MRKPVHCVGKTHCCIMTVLLHFVQYNIIYTLPSPHNTPIRNPLEDTSYKERPINWFNVQSEQQGYRKQLIFWKVHRNIHTRKAPSYVESDLVYPDSSIPFKMCSDCETCGLLNHYQEVCSDCEAYGLKKHGLTRSDCIAVFGSWRRHQYTITVYAHRFSFWWISHVLKTDVILTFGFNIHCRWVMSIKGPTYNA